jgi:[ribosomal protein S18]-alanine N-acetyltransferase
VNPQSENAITRIRSAAPSDIAFMLAIERACQTAAHWSEPQYRLLFGPGAEGRAQRVAIVGERVSSRSEAISGETQPLGFLVARHLGPEWELENLVVAPEARRMGVGQGLLEGFLEAARQTHSASVFLEVRESNSGARALYEKLGFHQTGRRKSYYTGPLEDAILYSLDLNRARE